MTTSIKEKPYVVSSAVRKPPAVVVPGVVIAPKAEAKKKYHMQWMFCGAPAEEDLVVRAWRSEEEGNTDFGYPEEVYATARAHWTAATAISLPGGGSRAFSSGLGVMRGLAALDLIDRARYLTSVSGGSWFSSAFIFGRTQSAEDDIALLGKYLGPAQCTLERLMQDDTKNASLATACEANHHEKIEKHRKALNILPQHSVDPFILEVAFRVLIEDEGVNAWESAVNERFGAPYGIKTSALFAASPAHADVIRRAHPALFDKDHILVPRRDGLPILLINSCLAGPSKKAQVPTKRAVFPPLISSAIATGSYLRPRAIEYHFERGFLLSMLLRPEHTKYRLGGLISTFAFGLRAAPAPPAMLVAGGCWDSRPTLFYDDDDLGHHDNLHNRISEHENHETTHDQSTTSTTTKKEHKWGVSPPRCSTETGVAVKANSSFFTLSRAVATSSYCYGALVQQLETNLVADDIITALKLCDQTPILTPKKDEPSAVDDTIFDLADGGDNGDNAGLVAALQRGVDSIFITVPTSIPLNLDWDPYTTQPKTSDFESYLAAYFGVLPSDMDLAADINLYGWNLTKLQLFESEAFVSLASTLLRNARLGRGAFAALNVTTVANYDFGIEPGRPVRLAVLYSHLDLRKFPVVSDWFRQLPADTRNDLLRGQHSSFPNFPYYKLTDISLTVAQVNLLANFQAWHILEHQDAIRAVLDPPTRSAISI